MRRRSKGLCGVLLLGAGCAPAFVPLQGGSAPPRFSSEALPASCADALRARRPGVGEGVVGAGLDKEDIRRVISSHRAEIENCYEASRAGRVLEGKVTVRFVIARGGEVCALEIHESSFQHPSLEACILNAFASWRFPESTSARTVVSYPFLFREASSPREGAPPAVPGG